MVFSPQLKYALASHSVTVDRPPSQPLSSDFGTLVDELKRWSGTDNDGVAASYFFRQYALFISAQFDLITNHNGYFACSWQELQFDRIHNYGFNLLQTHVESRYFLAVSPENRFQAMHWVLHKQTDEFIAEFRKHAKISPITLWENILGSLLWFYASVEKRQPRRAAEDMEWLLEPVNWHPIKTSYMEKLIGSQSLQRAISSPLRKTCCLYKELPHFETCTFCPNPN
ncbi:(2Fe-2S)-binding protein [Planococcus shixiaomingii]|uniref:(2Fe-2S)-binding protein n=1 Tax=Planococcus shixiaomingii TaxID=3058393 RepID=UPI0026153FD8|nr:(2Fe-2S)-binding protein [Planococcus sp. N022]WKA56780.1 (2Fe-2S)-binding protein [Planococcus sp. N022]